MSDRWSLRRRVTLAYLLLAGVVCSLLAAAALYAIEQVELQLIDRRLERTADRYAQRRSEGGTMDLPPGVTLYVGADIPAVVRQLPVGKHEVTLGTSSVNVLIRGAGDEAFALADDDAEFEAIRRQLQTWLAAGCVACLALALLLGRWTCSRVIAPLTALARAVAADRPPDQLPSMASQDELGLLARAFGERTQALQQMIQREQWFVADVSHELRTPLTVILGAAEVLSAQTRSLVVQNELAERIRRTAEDTAQRVAALLLLSRAPESLDAPRIDLVALVQQEVDRCRPLLLDKPVAMQLHLPATMPIHARPELAATAIGNLVRNACRYTEAGCIDIRLEPGRLTVQDTGIGIPPSLHERVFERLVRADGTSPDGSGLGLAIVRRVADHLGWQVRLASSSPAGSRFLLCWPVAD